MRKQHKELILICYILLLLTYQSNNQSCNGGSGDGIIDRAFGEICDDLTDGTACDLSTCQFQSGFGCTDSGTTSTCWEICGDGFNEGRNACDDGNNANRDGCSYTCTVETGWTCSGGGTATADTCTETCGDTVDWGTLTCEDGVLNSGGCDNSCALVSGYDCQGGDPTKPDECYELCGDGVNLLLGLEECDDGNTTPGDGCSSNCKIEDGYTCGTTGACSENCGDGMNMGTNECDDSNSIAGDGCDNLCAIETGWTCGSGSFAKFDLCFELCGDGRALHTFTPMGNMCDDGNNWNGDGCDADCVLEYGYQCLGGDTYNPDVCSEYCGDGFNIGLLACDDGNAIGGDGCSSTCSVEKGWTCSGGTTTSADTCTETCGDGYNYGNYFCDDGNLVAGDGCDATCDIESGWTCTGGTSTTPDFCWRPYSRIVSASLNDNNTVITLTFNETTFMLSTFTKDDIMVFISGPRDVYTYYFDILNINYFKGTGTGFTELQLQITYVNSGQFFGLNSEGIVVAVRTGSNFENYRFAPLLTNVWVLYANPRESDYKCGMDRLWEASYYTLFAYLGLNFLGFFFDISMNFFWSLIYFLQIISLLPLIQVYMPSCASLYIKDISIANGENYYIYTNFIGNTFWDLDFTGYNTKYWYGFERNDYLTQSFLGDAAGCLNCWLGAFLLIFFFNFIRAFFPEEPYFVDLERNYRSYALYKGLFVCYTQVIFCCLMNMNNIHYENSTVSLSGSLGALFFAGFIGFAIVHIHQSLAYRKLLAKDDVKELSKFKFKLLFGEFQKSHFVRYFYVWAFCLRRVLNAVIILNLQNYPLWQLNLLLLVNLLALVYSCISRPFNDTLLNVHTIINDVGVLIVIGEFYMMMDAYYLDEVYYLQGKIIIATIATIIFLNFILFLISFLLGFCAFLKRCPICTCCMRGKKSKEGMVYDPDKDINREYEELWKPPTPEPTPPPTPPREPTPPPSPPPTPPPPPKEETPESSEEEEIIIPEAAVLVKESQMKADDAFGDTMAGTQNNSNLNDKFIDSKKVKFSENLQNTNLRQ